MKRFFKKISILVLAVTVLVGLSVGLAGCKSDGESNNVESTNSAPSKIGYKFLGWYTNKDFTGEPIFDKSEVDENTKLYEKWDYDSDYFGELPVISISTNDKPITNKTDYVNMSFELFNTKDGEYDIEIPVQEGDVGIRLRGNSTMGLPKKPYRIKFDTKPEMFGLEGNTQSLAIEKK